MSIARKTILKSAFVLGVAGLVAFPETAGAQAAAPPAINQADTAWMLVATALVLLATQSHFRGRPHEGPEDAGFPKVLDSGF